MNCSIDSKFLESLRNDTVEFLYNLVSIPSVSNEETEACEYCYAVFEKIPGVELRKIFMDNSLRENPLWCSGPYPHKGYNGQFCIEATWKGTGEQDPIYFNAHIDTILPPSPGMLPPRIENDLMFGLGAEDDKGKIAIIYAMLRYLSANNLRFPFDVVMHIVVEEEIGGNGSLAITDRPLKGQAAVVLDGRGGAVYHAARGAIWLKLTCSGISRHPGSFEDAGKPKSAYELLEMAISIVEGIHEKHCEECRQNPVRYFEGSIPPINLGMVDAGNWPSTVPTTASAEILFAILPNCTTATMRRRIEDALDSEPELKGNCHVEYVFARDAGITNIDDPISKEVLKSLRDSGYDAVITSKNAVCDMYFYSDKLGFPTVSIGNSRAEYTAHSKKERIALSEIIDVADALLNWLCSRA